MQQTQNIQSAFENQSEGSERPLFVKSQNFKYSKVLRYPDEPPTDRQIRKLISIGYKGNIPANRKEASDKISEILKEVGQ